MRLATTLGLVVTVTVAGCGSEPEEACVDDATYFRDELYPKVVVKTCMSCHTEDGLARDSSLVFVPAARPDHVEVNRRKFDDLAGLERDGQSLVLRKPLGLDDHGGGAVLAEDSEAYRLLADYVALLDAPVTCPGTDVTVDDDAGLVLLPPTATLRKAALLLAGRLPTSREVDEVRAGGEAALERAIDAITEEPAFLTVLQERLNDVLLTDRYLLNDDGIGLMDDDRFPGTYWFEDLGPDVGKYRRRTSQALAREPLSLAAYIVANHRPWTEILTADYTVVDDFSGRAYGVVEGGVPRLDDPDASALREARVDGFPHAGLLTTPAFLNRYTTTATNRNRHRAWFFLKTFLATDILTFAKRPIDPTAVSQAHNPTLNDPQCTVCHATMDPVAGLFQSWDEDGREAPPEDGWYPDMVTPGFGDAELPFDRVPDATRWLAERAAADPRFAVATVRMMLHAFTGLDLLTTELAGDDPVKLEALAAQDAWVETAAVELVDSGYDLTVAVRRVVTSRWFRAVDDTGATDGALELAGTAHLLTPEELDRKIIAVAGVPWRRNSNEAALLLDRYRLLYGGIDSFGVTTRLDEANGVISAIGLRMANEVACDAVTADLVLDRAQRRLLPHVEASYAPRTDDGFAVPEAEAAIRRNLQWLHLRLLGEDLALDDPELDASYALWVDVWTGGRAALEAGDASVTLPDGCRGDRDPWTGVALPEARRITRDDDFTVRAWVAVAAYLLSDWRFLHE